MKNKFCMFGSDNPPRMTHFDSEETRKEEELLQKLFNETYFTDEQRMQIDRALLDLAQQTKNLLKRAENGELTEEETKYLKEILQPRLNKIVERLNLMKEVVDEKLYRESVTLMEHLKSEATNGNGDAQKAYEELHEKWKKLLAEKSNLN
jgi:hypothetical protein